MQCANVKSIGPDVNGDSRPLPFLIYTLFCINRPTDVDVVSLQIQQALPNIFRNPEADSWSTKTGHPTMRPSELRYGAKRQELVAPFRFNVGLERKSRRNYRKRVPKGTIKKVSPENSGCQSTEFHTSLNNCGQEFLILRKPRYIADYKSLQKTKGSSENSERRFSKHSIWYSFCSEGAL